MRLECSAVIVAGGSGSRLKSPLPKQFVTLAGRPLLAHTLSAFDRCPYIQELVLVLPREDYEMHRERMAPYLSGRIATSTVRGGVSRQASVWEGLTALGGEERLVAVHDGARPLIDSELIQRVIEGAETTGGAIAAVPIVETLKQVDNALTVVGTADRRQFYRAQTPQVFRYSLLMRAFEKAQADAFEGTDEASLVERLNSPIRIVPGAERNLKVTTNQDLSLVEFYLGQADTDAAEKDG